ncbi:AGE family epimerase/isomerase [Alteromonadaceae bacterium BrNp21-10]|nr:AGE family epimerase/isomerase [Alteromonadaceae bacterium BrNp21-10]
MTISTPLLQASEKFKTWMIHQALPFWSSTGIEATTGASHERLLTDGTPDLQSTKRIRVQCRQLFSYCIATEMGWMDNGLETVNGIVGFLNQHAINPHANSTFMHLLDKDNNPLDDMQDLYDMAFFFLAAGYRYKVFNDLTALAQADALLAHIENNLKVAPGGWMEGNYNAPVRRQNPHMHLFEAFLALYEATKDGKWLAKAGEIFCLFETVFFDAEYQVLREFFSDDWQHAAGAKGQIIEPGHMMEWVWLLRKYQQFTGTPVEKYCQALYNNALSLGQDKATGLLFDEISPTGDIVSASKRCWTTTEMLKANIAQAWAGDKSCEQGAADAIELLFKYYISDSVAGSYIDQLDGNNNVAMELAPASTLYHLILACIEAVKYCEQ